LTGASRPAASALRKIAAALILVPLAAIIVAFAVANRQIVTLSFDPFNSGHPAASATLPLFALIIAVLILGVVIGGTASWLRHGRWRRTARRLERELGELRVELDSHKHGVGAAPANIPQAAEPPQRLKLQAPLR
jgi:uncharacterized integral membrane protein